MTSSGTNGGSKHEGENWFKTAYEQAREQVRQAVGQAEHAREVVHEWREHLKLDELMDPEKLGEMFESGVARTREAFEGLGLVRPSQLEELTKAVEDLGRRLEVLTQRVEELATERGAESGAAASGAGPERKRSRSRGKRGGKAGGGGEDKGSDS